MNANPDPDRLTPAENRLLQHLKKGKKPIDAAYAALNPKNDNSARSMASQLMRRERFQRALEKAGLSDAVLARTFVDGIKASKAVVVDKKIYDYPDHSTRHQFLKTALVVKGYYRRTDDAEESANDPLVVKSIQMLNQTINVGTTSSTIISDESIEGSIASDKKDSGNPR
jgi:hypothetical protein